MSITADFHVHSEFSGDCDTPMEDMVTRAITLGYNALCITEHHDDYYPYTHGEPFDLFTLDTPAYHREYKRLQEKYKNQIKLLFGVELGVQHHIADTCNTYAQTYPFDFIIASSHLCNEKDPYYIDFFDGKEESEAYLEYFQSILTNIKMFQDFDVYGHLDYIVRYGPNKNRDYSYAKYSDVIDSILRLLIENGKGIEVNASGLKYQLEQTHPCNEIIKRYHELGGEILTIGSDAHAPHHIGYEFPTIRDSLYSMGFRYYTIFEKRTPIFCPL